MHGRRGYVSWCASVCALSVVVTLTAGRATAQLQGSDEQRLIEEMAAAGEDAVFQAEPAPRDAGDSGREVRSWAPAEGADVQDLGSGYRRTVETRRVRLTPEQMQEIEAAGRAVEIDPATGERIVEHIKDYLPADWLSADWQGQPGDGLVDSYGNPIVNEVDGLPDWAQRDVDGLRKGIGEMLLHGWNLKLALDGRQSEINTIPPHVGVAPYDRSEENMSTDLYETQRGLGNYIGQAIVRGLAYDDLVDLFDRDVVDDNVSNAVIKYLHFYENLKFVRADDFGYEYEVTRYDSKIEEFLAAWEATPEQVLAIESGSGDDSRSTPSGCYSKFTYAQGMTNLSGYTVIWEGGGVIDAQADIPIGFRSYFYTCDNIFANFNIRVSTHGYITYFEQGGGAEDGLDYTNDPITSTIDPDGYVAPWWDDLIVAAAQGTLDRVSYKTEGSVGQRVLTVEWYSVSLNGGDPDDWHFFQVKFIEFYENIEIHLSTDWNADSIGDATVGMEDFSGLDGDCGPNCDNNNTAPANNYRFFPSRPANDACIFAECLEMGVPAVGDNWGATGVDETSCGYNDFADVWYSFHATVTGTYTFDTCGSSLDTILAVFDACGGGELSCDDFSCAVGVQSELSVDLTEGMTYYVRVAGYNGSRGTFTLNVTGPRANGDTCDTCWTVGTSFSGYTTNNSGCDDESTCGSQDTIDEWFCWTAPCSGIATATTCNDTTDFDTTLAVFDACNGAQLNCNDDTIDPACELGGLNHKSRVSWDVTAGMEYVIRLAGYDGAQGNYLLEWDCMAVPPNDDCADAIAIGDGATTFTSVNASTDGPVDASECNPGGANPSGSDVWYLYTSGCTGLATASLCASDFDTTVSVYPAGCPASAANEIACDNDSCGAQSEVSFEVVEGGQYLIRIGGESGEQGSGTLVMSCACLDVTVPVAEISSPGTFGCTCDNQVIVGSAYEPDGTFDNYVVEYRPTGAATWTFIASSTSPVIGGTLTNWNTTGLAEGYYFVRVTAENVCGLTNTAVQIVRVDDVFDNLNVRAPVDEAVYGGSVCFDGTAWDQSCFDHYVVEYSPAGAGSWIVVDPANPIYTSTVINDGLAIWQTTSVPDGYYDVRVTAETDCGTTDSDLRQVTIDNTPPTAVITSPVNCNYVEGVVQVTGTASDTNLASWTLQYTGGSTSQWVTIASSTASVVDGVLADWDTAGLDACVYTLRLTVSDSLVLNCNASSHHRTEYFVSINTDTCGDFDADNDGDVDLVDFSAFIAEFTGPLP